MKRRITALLLMLLFAGLGCTATEKPRLSQPPAHPHYYPFTQVIGDYHVRLVVDHNQGKLALVYEGVTERSSRGVRSRKIEATAILPDGTVKRVLFRPAGLHRRGRQIHRRVLESTRPLAKIFTARAEWVKRTPAFKLMAEIPLKGRHYSRSFEYRAPGGNIPFHRK